VTENQAAVGGDGAPKPSLSRTERKWRGDWQIAVVVAVLVIGGFVSLQLVRSPHQAANPTPHQVVLPATLLGLSRDTGSHVANEEWALAQQGQVDASGKFVPVAGLYGNLSGGAALAVLVQDPCPLGDGCVLPTSSQVVQSMQKAGALDVQAFTLNGGVMACNTFRDSSQIHCGWIDQVTSGRVNFAGGYASGLPDAAAKTRLIVTAIEH